MAPYIDLLKLVLPEFLVTYFDLAVNTTVDKVLHLYYEENIAIPEEFSSRMVISHDFHKEVTIQDFPLRGKQFIFTLNAVVGLIRILNKLLKEIGI